MTHGSDYTVTHEDTSDIPYYGKVEISSERMILLREWLAEPRNASVDKTDWDYLNFVSHQMWPDEHIRDILETRASALLFHEAPAPVTLSSGLNPESTIAPAPEITSGLEPSKSLATVSTSVEPTNTTLSTDIPLDKEEEIRISKRLIRRVLTDALPVTGVQPVPIRKSDKKAHVDDVWSASLDRTTPNTEQLFGWPKHDRWTAYENSLTGPDGLLRKLTQVDKEGKLTLTHYVRIKEDTLALRGPQFLWRHGDIPGMAEKMPTLHHPVRTDHDKKERQQVPIDLADLRSLQEKNKSLLKYNNVLCHTTDILLELARRNTPAESADRAMINDTFKVATTTLENVMALHTASLQSHVTWERAQVMKRDTRKQCSTLLPHKAAAARLAPCDSDEHLFGSERSVLESDMKEITDDNKFVIFPGNASGFQTNAAAKAMPSFRRGAPTAGRGSGRGGGSRNNQSQRGRGPIQQKADTARADREKQQAAPPAGRGRGRGRGRGGPPQDRRN